MSISLCGYEHAARPGRRLHTGRHVHRITQGRVLRTQLTTNHADHDRSGADPNPDPQLVPGISQQVTGDCLEGGNHVQPRTHRPLGVSSS